jgi:hypothetical protein
MLSLSKRGGMAKLTTKDTKVTKGSARTGTLVVLVFLVVNPFPVIPAKAGNQNRWTPAFAGVTGWVCF